MTVEYTNRATQSGKHSAFTLVELLFVMVIVGVLVALSMAGFRGARESSLRKEAATEIGLFSMKLNDFKLDYDFLPESTFIQGTPPQSIREPGIYDPDPTADTYKSSSRALFLALTGRSNYSEVESEGRVYYNPPKKNVGSPNEGPAGDEIFADESKTYEEQTFESGSYFLDPWGNPYGYYYAPSDPKWKSFNSPSEFDLWSTAGKDDESTKSRRRWVTSWEK